MLTKNLITMKIISRFFSKLNNQEMAKVKGGMKRFEGTGRKKGNNNGTGNGNGGTGNSGSTGG